MQPVQFHLDWFTAMLLGILGIVFFKMVRSSPLVRRIQSSPLFVKPATVTPFRAIVGSWAAPTGVMAIFIALSGNLGRELESIFPKNSGIDVPAHLAVPSPMVPDVVSGVSHVDINTNRPKWIEEGNQSDDDIQHVVLTSKLWSTEAEADQELLPQAASIVRADFDNRHLQFFNRASHRLLSDDQITQCAVKGRYVEQIEQNFGTFSSPMYRLWLQVEVSPLVRTELYPAWKKAVLGNRILTVGTILALLTLAANAISLFSALKAVPNRRSIYVASIVASSVAAWVAADFFLLMRLCQ